MKQIIIVCILPLFFSLIIVYYIATSKQLNNFIFKENPIENHVKPKANYFVNFHESTESEEQFLKSGDSTETIYLFGSSELTNITDAIPFKFISRYFHTRVIGVGHAGNQCLSIYSQLLSNEQRLKDAPIVIIISPGWFESKSSRGTTSEIFLEYNSEIFLNKILKSENDTELYSYLYMRVSQLYNEFNSPNLELKLMNFKYLASRSIINYAIYAPLIFCDEILLYLKEKSNLQYKQNNEVLKRVSIIPETVLINWDSLYSYNRDEVMKESTNNNMGFSNKYFTENIHGVKGGRIEPVDEKYNIELNDFIMLVKLLKEKNAKASFIISPLNPLYYRNIKDILPAIQVIESEIKKNQFVYLNLLETNTDKYDKAILHDAMHMTDYAWYKIDSFIIKTYHLSK